VLNNNHSLTHSLTHSLKQYPSGTTCCVLIGEAANNSFTVFDLTPDLGSNPRSTEQYNHYTIDVVLLDGIYWKISQLATTHLKHYLSIS